MDKLSRKSSEEAARSPGVIVLAREPVLRLPPLTIEPGLLRVRHDDGREETLQPRIMQVLVALLRAKGEVVTRDALIADCWGGLSVGEDAINRGIAGLRRLSETLAKDSFEIATVPRVGFRLLPLASPDIPVARRPGRDASSNPSICVLPFLNISGEPEQDYFTDGITEDIITDLSKVSALFVVARATAFAHKGSAIGVVELARALGVTHLLEGSVRKASDRVRITAQLIDGVTGGQVWAERYDRDLTDIFALQDEISAAIVAALKLRLAPEEKAAIERRGTSNVEAYDLVLMARRYYVAASEIDSRRNETVSRLCRKAVEIDPGYAGAWALLALAQTLLYFSEGGADDGLAAADRALALDPALAEPHAVRARHLSNTDRMDEAFAEIDIALRLAPGSFEVNAAAAALSYRDRDRRTDDAIAYYETAMALMETDLGSAGMLVSCYTATGDAEALRRVSKIALARAERALADDPSSGRAIGFGVNALAALGDGVRARQWIDRALLIDPHDRSMRFNCACALAARLGDIEGAVDLLGPFFELASHSLMLHAAADTDLDSLRDHPNFIAMVAEAERRLGPP
jgi:adenylate cyclase